MKAPCPTGELRHYVHILAKQDTGQDAHGQPISQWVTISDAFARIEPLTGRDVEYARQLYHLASVRITMRYNAVVNNSSRIKHGARVYSVGNCQNLDERDVWLVLLCSEGAD